MSPSCRFDWSRLESIYGHSQAMRSQHSHVRSPLEAALWEFRDREKQWLAEKAALRREAEAERRQTRALQHRLERLQVACCHARCQLRLQ